MKKLLFILFAFIAFNVQAQVDVYTVRGRYVVQADGSFVIGANKDTLRASTQMSEGDTVIVTKEYLDSVTTGGDTTKLTNHIADGTIHYEQSAISIPASQISNFDTEVGNNPTVVSNTAKRTYPLADENKLKDIESGAEVNVNADWDATSGDAYIFNKPTIPTDYWKYTIGGAKTDLNLYSTSGTYLLPASALTNAPNTSASANKYLIVYAGLSDGYVYQQYIDYQTSNMWFRVEKASVWGAWRQTYDSGNINLSTVDFAAKDITASGNVTGLNLSGTNTGDQTIPTTLPTSSTLDDVLGNGNTSTKGISAGGLTSLSDDEALITLRTNEYANTGLLNRLSFYYSSPTRAMEIQTHGHGYGYTDYMEIGSYHNSDVFVPTIRIENSNYGGGVNVSNDLEVGGTVTAGGSSEIGGWVTDNSYAYFSNVGLNTSTDYALIQSDFGRTQINSSAGQDLRFRQGNVDRLVFDGTTGNATFSNDLDVGGTVGIYPNTTSNEGIELSSTYSALNTSSRIAMWENTNKLYGGGMYYDAVGNSFNLWVRNNAATDNNVLSFVRATGNATFSSDLEVGGSQSISNDLEVEGDVTATNYWGANKKSFNVNWDNSAIRYYKIATLPATNSSTGDGVKIVLNTLTSSVGGKGTMTLGIGNRSGVWYVKSYTQKPTWSVKIYGQDVYIVPNDLNYRTMSVTYEQYGWTSYPAILYDDPQASYTAPTGTLRFDSNDENTYPVNDDFNTGDLSAVDGNFSGNVAVSKASPSMSVLAPTEAGYSLFKIGNTNHNGGLTYVNTTGLLTLYGSSYSTGGVNITANYYPGNFVKVDYQGVHLGGAVYDGSSSKGTNGQVLSTTGTSTKWIDMTGGGGGSIVSVAAGNGMNFGTITTSGSVSLATPLSITATSTNNSGNVGTGHSHYISGLTTSEFASSNISQWTNNSGYITGVDLTATGITSSSFTLNSSEGTGLLFQSADLTFSGTSGTIALGIGNGVVGLAKLASDAKTNLGKSTSTSSTTGNTTSITSSTGTNTSFFWVGTQTQYNALSSYDDELIYLIEEE